MILPGIHSFQRLIQVFLGTKLPHLTLIRDQSKSEVSQGEDGNPTQAYVTMGPLKQLIIQVDVCFLCVPFLPVLYALVPRAPGL